MFLEKFAKLNSWVEEFGGIFLIQVYDDEIEQSDEPIMWLEFVPLDLESAYSYTDNDDLIYYLNKNNIDEFIYVDAVDFNDDIYFSLPQNKQDVCATVLFKRFIKHYRENYEDWPVRADFQNFALQEKFELAVKKGIFPEESLVISKFTNKEDWEEEEYYNKDARKQQWDVKNIILSTFKENNIQTDSNCWVINTPISQIETVLDIIVHKTKERLDIDINKENYDYLAVDYDDTHGFVYFIPIEEAFDNNPLSIYEYSLSNKTFYVSTNSTFIKDYEREFREIFDTTEFVSVSDKNLNLTVDEFFSNEITSTKRRLIKKKG